jgi:hypothetical protein
MAESNSFHIAYSNSAAISFIMQLHGDERWAAPGVTFFGGDGGGGGGGYGSGF